MSSYHSIQVHTSPAYTVTAGPGLLKECGGRLREAMSLCHMAVISDSVVAPLYLETVRKSLSSAGFSVSSYVFPAG